MADQSKSTANLSSCTAPKAVDEILMNNNNANGTINSVSRALLSNLFGNASANIAVASVAANTLVIRSSNTPANSTITVDQGTVWFDSDYIYIATANNVVKRATLGSF